MLKQQLFSAILCLFSAQLMAQSPMVTYLGNGGQETLYDVFRLSDGTFLTCGYAADLDWLDSSVPRTELSSPVAIPNALGKNRIGFMLRLSKDLSTALEVVHFPRGVVEDIRFVKTNALPNTTTGDLYISCNTADSDNNDGGYILAKLNHNFLNGTPDALDWVRVVWAKSYAKEAHPWDVTSDGRVYFISGAAHGYDWSAVYCLNPNGQPMPVNNWRTHWLTNGAEWRGTPAAANPLGSLDSVRHSGIVLKSWGRCEMRSWAAAEFDAFLPDGNGGTKKGTWPADFLYSSPCDPQQPTTPSPGYNGYGPESCCPVWGGSSVAVDRRNNHLYLGMNFKSYSQTANSPDFEPAVIAYDNTGNMLWWSRLYHEITPAGDTVQSLPDQYIDALAIDYTGNSLVVGARAHGNNVENLWEGNQIEANPTANAFQNRFTGTNGNIHQSWLGKLRLADGVLTNATYLAEYAEGTGSLGAPHPDPNLDGWPNPNGGWPDVNTTRMTKNALKVTASGDVCVLAVGRRTITTANAYQKMVKPQYGGKSCWNSFVRVYDAGFVAPKYSSLVVGVWDTLTGAGGDNTELFGVWKTEGGVVAVGRHTADAAGVPKGNLLPVAQVPAWGTSTAEGESAILVYYPAAALNDTNDGVSGVESVVRPTLDVRIFPNPSGGAVTVQVAGANAADLRTVWVYDQMGKLVTRSDLRTSSVEINGLKNGVYAVKVQSGAHQTVQKLVVCE